MERGTPRPYRHLHHQRRYRCRGRRLNTTPIEYSPGHCNTAGRGILLPTDHTTMSNPSTSRTGTTKWRKTRADIIRKAKQAGQTNCPLCATPLDYHTPHQHNSAEVDHIKPIHMNGTDEQHNLRVICMLCNRTRHNKHRYQRKPVTIQLTTRLDW